MCGMEDVGKIRRIQRRKVQKDPDIAELIAKADHVVISKKLEDELRDYYVSSRDLATGKFSHRGVSTKLDNPVRTITKINEVLLDILAYRDRLTDIQGSLLHHNNTLGSAMRVAKELIHERYSDIMKTRGSLSTQEIFIESVLEPLVEKQEYVAMVLKRIELMLKNLDNAHFTYKELGVNIREMTYRVEGGTHSNVKIKN